MILTTMMISVMHGGVVDLSEAKRKSKLCRLETNKHQQLQYNLH